MSEQPIYPGARPVIGAQLPEFQALTVLATTAGHMPPLHVTASAYTPGSVQLSTQDLPAFEAWRAHLDIPVEAVRLHAYATNSWLTMDTAVSGVRLEFACHLDLTPEAALLSPQEDAQRRQAGALLVQRHELEDAAVPPLAAASPAVSIEVRPLTDAKGGTA